MAGNATGGQGVVDNVLCNDCNPCTVNLYFAATDSCQFPPSEEGTSCSAEDACYLPGVAKQCSCGACVSARDNCPGICTTIADCPPLNTTVPGNELIVQCLYGSCFYTLLGLSSQLCSTWLADTALVQQDCLYSQQTFNQLSVDDPEVDNFCAYQYKCAPIVYPPTVEPTPVS